jgi:predicted metallopeptidase
VAAPITKKDLVRKTGSIVTRLGLAGTVLVSIVAAHSSHSQHSAIARIRPRTVV